MKLKILIGEYNYLYYKKATDSFLHIVNFSIFNLVPPDLYKCLLVIITANYKNTVYTSEAFELFIKFT